MTRQMSLTLYVALFVLVGCASGIKIGNRTYSRSELTKIALEDKDSGMRVAALQYLTDKAVLAKVATEDESRYIRAAAVGKLTDQRALAKIAFEDKDSDVREAATRKLTDESLLAKIAFEDKESDVRAAAVGKLTDQGVLAKVALEDKALSVSRTAIGKLTDQGVLAKLATENWNTAVRSAAVERLTDQSPLAQVFLADKDRDVRYAALERLRDPSVLARADVQGEVTRLATGEQQLDLRLAAMRKVIDQALLRRWATEQPQAVIRQAAVSGIAEDGFLVEALAAEPSAAVRATIVAALHTKESLRQVALTGYRTADRRQAFERLKREFQDPAPDVASAHQALVQRIQALKSETDADKLRATALDGEFLVLRMAAAQHLDLAGLEAVASRGHDREVLKIALARIEDRAVLDRIANSAQERAVRLAAARKAEAQSWAGIFGSATARGAGAQALGDALAAVSLFDKVQPDAAGGVQEAALSLIRQGNEARIPEMVDLLETYGDKQLAEDYMNCGQPDLDAAARIWASKRGYRAGTGRGSHRARWGKGG